MQVLEEKQQSKRTAHNSHSRHSIVISKKLVNMPSLTKQTFLVWCPMPTLESGIAEAIHALYYLPENFMLMLPHAAVKNEEIPMIIAASPLANRIQFYDSEGSSTDEPSLIADAILCSETYIADAQIPVIIVSNLHGGLSANGRGYTVGCSPEAIASALLSVARESIAD